MNIPHKIFLYWLLYITVIISAITAATLSGLVSLVISHDHSYLTYVLIGIYLLAELLTAKQVISTNLRHKEISDVITWLQKNIIKSITIDKKQSIIIRSYEDTLIIKKGLLTELLLSFTDNPNNCGIKQIDQGILLNRYMEKLYRNANICEFLSERIEVIGILATIIGVTLAFWPFLQPGMNIDMMREHVGQFFPGVAVAFIPTAVSFVFKLVLDVNSRILNGGVDEVLDMTTNMCVTYILPFLESNPITEE